MNPKTSKNIYLFPDVPHLLKLLRNHCIDYGFAFHGTSVKLQKSDFSTLIQNDGKELKLAPKLRQEHLDVMGIARQRVRPAAQMFSEDVALSFKRVFGTDCQEISDIILTIDQWFDACNSRHTDDNKTLRSGSGLSEDKQFLALSKMEDLVKNIRYLNNPKSATLKPFQQGILVSIKSIVSLYNEIKSEGFRYMLTSRLNQDCLENLFSRLRCIGGDNTHPSPIIAMDRLRLLTIGKSPQHVVQSPSVQIEDESSMITFSLIDEFCTLETDSEDEEEPESDPDFVPRDERPNTNSESCNDDTLEYIVGFISKKLGLHCSAGSTPASTSSTQTSQDSWIDAKSNGNLIKPSAALVSEVRQCDEIFLQYFGKNITKNMRSNPIVKLNNLIFKKHPEISS